MDYSVIKSQAAALFDHAGFISQITSSSEYDQAIELMDELTDNYSEANDALIAALANSIERWEDEAPEFAEFNKCIEGMDAGVATLITLMDQYQLKAADLREEIGGKSLVSMILNGTRQLTREHIQALSHRFNISPAHFFDT